MNQANTTKLLQAFPRLYGRSDCAIDNNFTLFSFECGDGWFQLIWDLSVSIEAEADKAGLTEQGFPQATVVKEKYGTLRVYLSNYTDEIFDLVESAEERSAHICEACGKAGREHDDGWLKTRCDHCD